MITNQDLEFVRNYSKRKRARDEILDRIRERVDVHSVQYDKILAKGGPERDRMAEHVAAIDEAERRWTAETIEDDRRYIRVCEEIGRLPQPENDVLRYRYIDLHSWRWIARRLHYSERELFRIQRRALRRTEDENCGL